MSKLPEKFKSIIVQQVQPNEASVEIVEMLTAEQSKINEIIDYLSELQEQNKPCEHNSSYAVDSTIGDIYYNVCNDCGVLFLRSQDVD